MIRTWYTGASGMIAQQWRLDAISNNLANVDTDAYKKDTAVHKAFPELLLRRLNDDGVYNHPFGSADAAPIIGKIGTGVELNELFTSFEQGALKLTESDFDFALEGKGFLVLDTPHGPRYTRNGSFQLGKEGFLESKDGFPVMGENGPIRVKAGNFTVDAEGQIWVNARYNDDDPEQLVAKDTNAWEETVFLDRFKIVDFDLDRYLAKQGSSLYRSTTISGEAELIDEARRPRLVQGFVEASNVNAVTEMVQMIEVNRAYEANQKVVQAGDAMLGKLINEIVRV